jgi:hypothetical protein
MRKLSDKPGDAFLKTLHSYSRMETQMLAWQLDIGGMS